MNLKAEKKEQDTEDKKHITRYIANRAFGSLREFSTIYKHRQIVDLAFINE